MKAAIVVKHCFSGYPIETQFFPWLSQCVPQCPSVTVPQEQLRHSLSIDCGQTDFNPTKMQLTIELCLECKSVKQTAQDRYNEENIYRNCEHMVSLATISYVSPYKCLLLSYLQALFCQENRL